jgi:hypothetical protein
MEVNQRGRKATVEWVEQQIERHRRMAAHKLILVSRTGFTSGALAKVEFEKQWVKAVEPEVIMVDGEPVVRRLRANSITYSPTRCTVAVMSAGEELVEVAGQPDTDVYDSEGTISGCSVTS